MHFVMNHAPGAGSIAQPIDQQSSWATDAYLDSEADPYNIKQDLALLPL